jgi:RadC-like JAB domain-containing protein
VIKIERPRNSVTERDERKPETCTAPNPRPLLDAVIGNNLEISRRYCAA